MRKPDVVAVARPHSSPSKLPRGPSSPAKLGLGSSRDRWHAQGVGTRKACAGLRLARALDKVLLPGEEPKQPKQSKPSGLGNPQLQRPLPPSRQPAVPDWS